MPLAPIDVVTSPANLFRYRPFEGPWSEKQPLICTNTSAGGVANQITKSQTAWFDNSVRLRLYSKASACSLPQMLSICPRLREYAALLSLKLANYLRTGVHPTCGCGFVYKFTLNCKTTSLIARNQIKLSIPVDLVEWSWAKFLRTIRVPSRRVYRSEEYSIEIIFRDFA